MKVRILITVLLLFSISSAAQDYSWKAEKMDGSRTGCVAPSRDNVPEALGTFKGAWRAVIHGVAKSQTRLSD